MLFPLDVLGVNDSATDEQIKKAYLRLIREHPPEREPERFAQIRDAYELCKTEKLRLSHRLFSRSAPDFVSLIGQACRGAHPGRPDPRLLSRALAESLDFPIDEGDSDV